MVSSAEVALIVAGAFLLLSLTDSVCYLLVTCLLLLTVVGCLRLLTGSCTLLVACLLLLTGSLCCVRAGPLLPALVRQVQGLQRLDQVAADCALNKRPVAARVEQLRTTLHNRVGMGTEL